MDTETTYFVLVTVVSTLFGSGIATAIMNHFFRRSLEKELDNQRAFLQRQTKVHELQIQTLTKLYSILHSLHRPLREFAKYEDFYQAVDTARAELTAHRLLIPRALADKMDNLFEQFSRARSNYNLSFNDQSFTHEKRSELWARFYAATFEEIPGLLNHIEEDARKLIHGEK
jgi:hypothetical protein